jgi:multiple sugar transport system permease protein
MPRRAAVGEKPASLDPQRAATPLILNNRAEFMRVVTASLVSDLFVFHNLMLAICLIAPAPSMVLVLRLRRFVVEGLSAGATKG